MPNIEPKEVASAVTDSNGNAYHPASKTIRPGVSLKEVDLLIDSSFNALPGWMAHDKAKRVARIITELPTLRAPLCVELGVFGGRGLVAMGLPIKHLLDGRGRVDGIDPYTRDAALEGTNEKANQEWWAKLDYEAILKQAQDGISRLGLQQIARIIRTRSQDCVDDYNDQSIDVLHQDSNHSEEVSCHEVATWTRKVRPGGLWIFDDTNWPSTHRAQSNLIAEHGFTLLEGHETWAVFRAP